jgi:hypothetical protein
MRVAEAEPLAYSFTVLQLLLSSLSKVALSEASCGLK